MGVEFELPRFYPLDHSLHPLPVRAFPVDLPAGGADGEFVEILFCKWFEFIKDFRFFDRFEQSVAFQASFEW